MRIFLTGATGFVGSRIVPELLAAGHQVLGLARSDAGARQLAEAGAGIHRGTVADLASLRAGAEQADAIIHTAFVHDFTTYAANCAADREAIRAMGTVLRGSDRPFLVTSACTLGDAGDGAPALESVFDPSSPAPRAATERAVEDVLQMGVDARVVRLPQVHDPVRQGLITFYIDHARRHGMAGYVGEGADRWSAGHVSDVARLYSLALTHGKAGARYHAAAEEGVLFRQVAEAVATGLDVPAVALPATDAADHFGWLAAFIGRNGAASSTWTRAQLDWQPHGPGLVADLQAMNYAAPPV
ncbi:SDR family oxidoreductase [Croceibacterium sp. TMG7-5b_MA50]|uniref:SDR family oxidoreductase n=1 Tax=Croceibacterium sp. TMG7-5b_MA50 TaxID=3121290 RepID=UPI003221EA6D